MGVSIRDLTLAESIGRRNQQAQLREPLAFTLELFGLRFEPPATALRCSSLVWRDGLGGFIKSLQPSELLKV